MAGGQAPALWTTVLGPVRAWRAGAEVDLGTPQQRALFALLLARPAQPVSTDELVDALWPGNAPATAVNVIHRYVSRLRRALGDTTVLTSVTGGYRLDVTAGSADLLLFRELRDDSRLLEALELWRGPVAAGIGATVRAHPVFTAIDGELTAVLAQAAAHAPSAERILPRLRATAADRPLDERMQAALMRTLAATGNQAEALEVFAATRRRLDEELGINPGTELTAAHGDVLRVPAVKPASPPAQLPGDLPSFAGRHDETGRLDELLRRPGALVTVSGMGGVGKTSLVVHCAHRLAPEFPDGVLYANLRGFDPSGAPMETGDAVRGFLDALGVGHDRVPPTVEAQTALYRSMLAGRRMLVVLDNVRDSDHARPLLPASQGCATVVTSRTPLTGLVVAYGAQPLALGLLGAGEAQDLLEQRLGRERIGAEPAAAAELARLCDGLPLALAIVAARAAIHPAFTLADVVAELRDGDDPLEMFGTVDTGRDVRAVFSWSYRSLSEPAARLFRELALHPGPHVRAPAVASLLGEPLRRARALLGELTGAQLLTEQAAGRYRFHDLLRAYANGLVVEEETDERRREVVERLFDHHVRSATAAADALVADRTAPPIEEPPALPGVVPETFADQGAAMAWLIAERAVLLDFLDVAVTEGADLRVIQLASALHVALQRFSFWGEWERSQRLALAAAQRLDDPPVEGFVRYALGEMFSPRFLNRPDESMAHFGEALRLLQAGGDLSLTAHLQVYFADLYAKAGRPEQERSHLAEALALFGRMGNPDDEADWIAHTLHTLGRNEEALELSRRAIPFLRDAGMVRRHATALVTLSTIHAALGDPAAALESTTEAAVLYERAGDRYLTAEVLVDSALHLMTLAGSERAAETLCRAADLFAAIGAPRAQEIRAVAARLTDSAGTADVAELSSRYARRPRSDRRVA